MAGWPFNFASQRDIDDVRERLGRLESAPKPESRLARRITFIGGVLGFVATVITVPVLVHQNALLSDQLEVQRQTLEIQSPRLEGTAHVVMHVLLPGLFETGTGGVERVLGEGETADRDSHWVRVEVTNGGLATGAIASAGLLVDGTYLPVEAIYCGIERDDHRFSREECGMPLKVEPAETRVFIFDIPLVACGAVDATPRPVTAYFTTVTGAVKEIRTEVLTSFESYCPTSDLY